MNERNATPSTGEKLAAVHHLASVPTDRRQDCRIHVQPSRMGSDSPRYWFWNDADMVMVESTIELSEVLRRATTESNDLGWEKPQYGETQVLVRTHLDGNTTTQVLIESGLDDDAENRMSDVEALLIAIDILQATLARAEAILG